MERRCTINDMVDNTDDRLNTRGSGGGWLKENFASIVLPILAIIVLVGGLYLYTTGRDTDETLTEGDVTAQIADTDTDSDTSEDDDSDSDTGTGGPDEDVVMEDTDAHDDDTDRVTIIRTGDDISVTAQRGDGITHLARRALAEYTADTNQDDDMTPEHNVYAEDYVQNYTGTHMLEVGETLTFSNELLGEAVDASMDLTPAQLDNLTQYAELVPSFY